MVVRENVSITNVVEVQITVRDAIVLKKRTRNDTLILLVLRCKGERRMKLIIELDDDIAKGIRGENECEVEPREIVRSFQATIADAIVNGTPYNPSGDLISRSEAEKLGATCLARRNENGQLEAIISLDNAPTIEIPVARWDCYCEGQKVGFKKAEDVFERMKLIQETVDCIRNKFNLNTKSNKLVRNCMALVQNAIDGEYHDMEEVDMKGGAE